MNTPERPETRPQPIYGRRSIDVMEAISAQKGALEPNMILPGNQILGDLAGVEFKFYILDRHDDQKKLPEGATAVVMEVTDPSKVPSWAKNELIGDEVFKDQGEARRYLYLKALELSKRSER